MKELVDFLARHLVNHPESVEVKETQGDTASVLELRAIAPHAAAPKGRGTRPRQTRTV
jgi:predicted RNA-binding protein YlqC (UPF0109 family)